MQRKENTKQNISQEVPKGNTINLFKIDKFMLYASVIPFLILAMFSMMNSQGEVVVELLTYAAVFAIIMAGARMEKQKRMKGLNTESISIFMWGFSTFAFFNIIFNDFFAAVTSILVIVFMMKYKIKMNTNWLSLLVLTFFGINFIYAMFQDYQILFQLSLMYDPLVYARNFWMYIIAFPIVLFIALVSIQEGENEKQELENLKTEDIQVPKAEVIEEVGKKEDTVEEVVRHETNTIEETRISRVEKYKQKNEEMEKETKVKTKTNTIEEKEEKEEKEESKGFFNNQYQNDAPVSFKEKAERKLSKYLNF